MTKLIVERTEVTENCMGENKKVFLSYLPSTKVVNLTSNATQGRS